MTFPTRFCRDQDPERIATVLKQRFAFVALLGGRPVGCTIEKTGGVKTMVSYDVLSTYIGDMLVIILEYIPLIGIL